MGYKPLCHKAHRYDIHFELLPEYQGTVSRHRCAACAFELGQFHAINGIAKADDDSVLAKMPYSQAGSVRHKEAFISYLNGYRFGLSVAKSA